MERLSLMCYCPGYIVYRLGLKYTSIFTHDVQNSFTDRVQICDVTLNSCPHTHKWHTSTRTRWLNPVKSGYGVWPCEETFLVASYHLKTRTGASPLILTKCTRLWRPTFLCVRYTTNPTKPLPFPNRKLALEPHVPKPFCVGVPVPVVGFYAEDSVAVCIYSNSWSDWASG